MATRRNQIRQLAKVIFNSEQKLRGSDQEAVVDAIVTWIIRAGLAKKLPLIKQEIQRLEDRNTGTARLTMISARELPKTVRDHAQEDIAELLNAKTVVAEWSVDPALVGGVRAVTHDYEIRSSITDMLQSL